MCGIFATQRDRSYALPMLESLRHRGPDALDLVSAAGFSVGAVRLAIVDTRNPDANQPHLTRRGNIVAFNGEIYNYRKLWRSAPSEVTLIGEMIDDGLDPRQFFDGDYAILHFNPSIGRVTLFRDRFGICPLYYSMRPVVEVSSEARRLPRPREVPAHGRVVIDLKKRRVIKRDIMPLYGATSSDVSFRGLCDEIMESVRTRAMHTDSSFSLALSGGLDSTVIALALRNLGLRPEMCMTTYFMSDSEDLECAHSVASLLHFSITTIPIRSNDVPKDRILEHLDCHDPKKNTSLRWQGALRSWFVAEESPTRVILCGDGVDELIGGYAAHWKVSGRDYQVNSKRISTLRSMQHFNLDRTNKMGMAHSKEFRAPFLSSSLSQMLLTSRYEHPKMLLRRVINYWGGPQEVAMRVSKYSPDELGIKLEA